ncbi:MAG: MaoC family dehydratase [Rhizobiaceae bacterium]|nr:MaoC family dehydratase [Rhizobiaceae bacterium]
MREKAPTFEELRGSVGQELGVSDWLEITQERIDMFAACTGDHQWIHVDREMARRRSPLRTTIAHGYLSLSLVSSFIQGMRILPENTQGAFNHGVDMVRFIAPVRSGARVRLRTTLVSMEDVGPRQYLLKASNTLEIDGEPQPAMIAETLVMLYEKRG